MKFADHAREYVMVSDDLHREIGEEQFFHVDKYVVPKSFTGIESYSDITEALCEEIHEEKGAEMTDIALPVLPYIRNKNLGCMRRLCYNRCS